MDTIASHAWAALTALCLPINQLKSKHGVTLLHSTNQHELRFESGKCILTIARHDNTVFAAGRKPDGADLDRRFSVQGDVESPVLVEDGTSIPKRVFEVFEELMAWLHDPACELKMP